MPNMELLIKEINFTILRDKMSSLDKQIQNNEFEKIDKSISELVRGRFLYISKTLHYDRLVLLLQLLFSSYFGRVVEYLANTHPSLNPVTVAPRYRHYFYVTRYCLVAGLPVTYYNDNKLYISPVSIKKSDKNINETVFDMSTGLSSAFLLLKIIYEKVIKRTKERSRNKSEYEERMRDFFNEFNDDNELTRNLIKRFKIVERRVMQQQKSKSRFKKQAPQFHERVKSFEEMSSYMTLEDEKKKYIHDEINNSILRGYVGAPCLARIIIRMIDPEIEVGHFERVVLLSVLQAFHDNSEIHAIFKKYLQDYDEKRTNYFLNYSRERFSIPNNCTGVIKKDLCVCQLSPEEYDGRVVKGCCGTTVYREIPELPDEIKKKLDELFSGKLS